MTDPYPTGPVVYILRNGKSLYVGATIDLSHRIRQHNGELSGGAHRTSTKGPGTRPEALSQSKVRRLSSLPLRRLPTRCCEVAGRVARAPRVGFGPFRSRKPARACSVCYICCAGMLGFCMMPGRKVLAGLHVRSVLLLATVRVRVLCERVLVRYAPASPLARACALHLLCRDAGVLHDAGMMVNTSGSVYARRCVQLCLCACFSIRSAPASLLANGCAASACRNAGF